MAETNGHEDVISAELLTLMRALGAKAQTAKATYETVIQEIGSQYKLADGDHVDITTGKITRKSAEQPQKSTQ